MQRRLSAGALLILVSMVGGALPPIAAHAQQSARSGETLRNALDKRRAPDVSRYVSAAARPQSVGALTRDDFVVDRSGAVPLVRFVGDAEIYALTVMPAARGDEIFRFDTGEEFLRLPAVGSATTYDAANPAGAAVTLMGEAPSLPPAPEGDGETLLQALESLDETLLSRLGRLPEIAVPVSGDLALYADAVRVLERAALRTDADKLARARLATLQGIVIASGETAKAGIVGDKLVISVKHDAGYAGRPSSLAILAALRG